MQGQTACQVGIFWINDGRVIAFTEDVESVRAIGGFKDSDLGHDACWEQVALPGEYMDTSRGRVLYDVRHDTFRLFVPSALVDDRTTLDRIRQRFNLPPEKVQVWTDPHYELDDDPFGDDWD